VAVFKKRWCVAHVPSLLDISSGELATLTKTSFWGCVYRNYIASTITEVASILLANIRNQ
jgi:hypothetical protein